MAKKKKSQKKKSHKEYTQHKSAYYEEVKDIFDYSSSKLANVYTSASADLAKEWESWDVDRVRMKRRCDATLRSIDELKMRFPGSLDDEPDQRYSEVMEWALANALNIPAYDKEESLSAPTLGIALWMMDQLRDAGRVQDAVRILPQIDYADEENLPLIWDASHNYNDLVRMVTVIRQRNKDCINTKNNGHTRSDVKPLKRVFMDTLTAENKHRQDVPSRNLWEEILAMVPQDKIDRAVTYYQNTFWDWVRRYVASRSVWRKRLRDVKAKITDGCTRQKAKPFNIGNGYQGIPVQGGTCSCPVSTAPFAMPLNSPTFTASATMTDEILDEALDRQEKMFVSKWGEFLSLAYTPYSLHFKNMEEIFGEICGGKEIASIWKDFTIDQPYEFLFAHLYLTDTGSDLPWIYLPGISLFSLAAAEMPWGFYEYDYSVCDGIWNHIDPETGKTVCGPRDYTLPSKVKVPELENWYRLDYMDRTEENPEYGRRNLSQIVYATCGGIMPRNLERYKPALEELYTDYNITGKKPLHLLMYIMSLLGETRMQNSDRHKIDDFSDQHEESIEAEPEEEAAESPEELKRKISELRNQLDMAKKSAYEHSREFRLEKEQREKLERELDLERQELADLRELVFHQQEGEYQSETPETDISFPYKTKLRTVVFGGHSTWAKEIKPRLPEVRFVDRETNPNADLIRHADIVWIQPNAMSHASFYKIIDEIRKYNIPLRYFSYASAIKCAEQLAKHDENS